MYHSFVTRSCNTVERNLHIHARTWICKLTLMLLCSVVCWMLIANMHTDNRTIQYSESELRLLRNTATVKDARLPHDVFTNIKQLGILRDRGCRAGSHIRRHIKVVEPRPRLAHCHVPESDQRRTLSAVPHDESEQLPSLPAFLLVNARSLCNKFDDFELTVSTQYSNTHLIAVTETWFSPNKPATCYEITNFKLMEYC